MKSQPVFGYFGIRTRNIKPWYMMNLPKPPDCTCCKVRPQAILDGDQKLCATCFNKKDKFGYLSPSEPA